MDHRSLSLGIIFLLAQVVFPAGGHGQDEGQARKLINSQGCKACHTLEGDGGTLAGSFEDIRNQRSRAEIRVQLVNQEQKHGSGKIPDFSHLSAEEIEALVYFIQPEPQP